VLVCGASICTQLPVQCEPPVQSVTSDQASALQVLYQGVWPNLIAAHTLVCHSALAEIKPTRN